MRKFFGLILAALMSAAASAQLPSLKPGWNLFSKDQDIQLGREAAAQVEKQGKVLNNPELNDYVRRVGQKLAAQPQAGNFPYTFKVVNDKSVNAFALPGGPAFINVGLLRTVDNEAQLAGVLAHEMSHVALRHGTHQASTANAIQIPAALAGAILGRNGGILGSVAQLGLGLGANSALLKFSRTAEQQADELGVQMMAAAGYNPLELAHFFEKLEAQGGSSTLQFLSDHPNPGNRVRYIQEEIRYLPQGQYNADTGQLPHIKSLLSGIPQPPSTQSATASPAAMRPSGNFKEYRSQAFSISYPDNWKTIGDEKSTTVTIAPPDGLFQTRGGSVQVGYGALISFYFPEGDRLELRRDTEALLAQLRANNPSMGLGRESTRELRVDGQSALLSTLYSASAIQGEDERDLVITVPRPEGLFYVVLIAPQDEYAASDSVFKAMIESIHFLSR